MNCVLLSRLLARLLILQTCIPRALPALVCSYDSGAGAQRVFKPNASLNLPVNSTGEATTSNDTGPFGSYQYVWNKTSISARDYQQSFCPRRCQNEELVLLHDAEKNCPSLNCFPCECGRPKCEIYGVCCPDVTEPFQPPPGLNYAYAPNPPSPPGSPRATILPSTTSPGLRMGCDSVSSDEGPFAYISSCPHAYPGDDRTVKLCEDVSQENATLDVLTRSVDTTTGAIYRNRHCAVCNGVAEALQMNIKIECKTFMSLYDSQETEELFQRAMDDPNCKVEQIVPEGAVRLTCEDGSFSEVIDSCSQPDTEMYHDKDVVQACADLTDAIYTVRSPFTGQYYKNVFCAVCNTDVYPGYGDSCQCNATEAGAPDPLPFTMLLSFVKHDTPGQPPSTHSNCSDAEWPSPDGRCMSLQCVPGKRPENKSCVAIFPQVVALSYTIRLWLIPDVNHLQDDLDIFLFLRMILAKLELYLEAVTQNYAIKCGTLEDARQTSDSHATGETSFFYWSEISMIADGQLTRDVVERRVSETLAQHIISVEVNSTSDINLTPCVVLGDFDFTTYCGQTPGDNVCNFVTGNDSPNKMLPKTNTSIVFTSTLGCRFVSFNSSQYTVRTLKFPFNVIVSLNLGAVTLNFSEIPDLNMLTIASDGCLNVCEELLDEKLSGVKTSPRRPPVNNALYVVTMVSLGASMLGLALTLITYCRFPVLRSMAGMHTVLLSATLLCAQALLVASSHVKPPSIFCTALGIVTHFVWLLKFTWTFICSFQMLRVFTAKTRSPAPTGRKRRVRLLKLSLGSLVLPAVVIAGVICYSGVSSHGEDIGYGVTQCYLDQQVVVGVAVAGPALAISTCNIIFFCVTVVAISRIRKLHKPNTFSKDDHRNLHVYVKLSTMTGAFWAVSILAENLENDVLRFFAVVINGLQGVFIFLSYACNKRVLYYYLPCLSGSDASTRVTHKTNLDPAHRDTSTF